jgi:four helix bundle protein
MRSLETLDAYRLGRELAVAVYDLARARPLSGHPVLADQIARAAISIPANIAEGYALGTRRQLVRGVRIAYGSAAELKTHFWIAHRVEALPDSDKATSAIANLDRVTGMLIGLLKRYGGRAGG